MGIQSQREYLKLVWQRYQKANRKERSLILDELQNNLRLHRKSATRLMNAKLAPRLQQGQRGGRQGRYSNESKTHLERLWKDMGYMCAERMKAALPEWLAYYDGRGFNQAIKKELLAMSISSIKRFLCKAKRDLRRKQNCGTKPGNKKYLAKVPIRNLEATPDEVGHCEIDLVAHCGGSLSGEFAWTLNLTDIASGWTECEAIWAKNGVEVRKALRLIEKRLPFPIKALYSDNGSEFMNKDVIEGFATKDRVVPIKFFRGRPYRKNDQCYVEQKNNTHVRSLFGYGRMDWKPGVKMMNAIYRKEWTRLQNYFMPQQKLISKTRVGSKLIRKLDGAKTPIDRLKAHLTKEQMRKIQHDKASCNPFKLRNNQKVKVANLNGYFTASSGGNIKGKMAS